MSIATFCLSNVSHASLTTTQGSWLELGGERRGVMVREGGVIERQGFSQSSRNKGGIRKAGCDNRERLRGVIAR